MVSTTQLAAGSGGATHPTAATLVALLDRTGSLSAGEKCAPVLVPDHHCSASLRQNLKILLLRAGGLSDTTWTEALVLRLASRVSCPASQSDALQVD